VTASVSRGGTDQTFLDTCAQEVSCNSGVSSVFTGNISARPGSVLTVTLGASAYAENGGQDGFAYIDPYFYLGPDDVAAGYSLSFSDSVGNSASVPLPGTAGLLLAGLGLLIPQWRRNTALRAPSIVGSR